MKATVGHLQLVKHSHLTHVRAVFSPSLSLSDITHDPLEWCSFECFMGGQVPYIAPMAPGLGWLTH